MRLRHGTSLIRCDELYSRHDQSLKDVRIAGEHATVFFRDGGDFNPAIVVRIGVEPEMRGRMP
jgi:hypothetical protein